MVLKRIKKSLNSLKNDKLILKKQQRFRSETHNVSIEEIEKDCFKLKWW